MVAGKLLVLPMRPGEGTVSCLLVGSMIGARSAEGACASTVGVAASNKKQIPRFARNDNNGSFARNDNNWRRARSGCWANEVECSEERITAPPRRSPFKNAKCEMQNEK